MPVPAAGDDLGGFMRMPQGADAHLVVSLDPVVQLGGLPVPDVKLSVGVSWHHIAGRDEKVQERQKESEVEEGEGEDGRLTLC